MGGTGFFASPSTRSLARQPCDAAGALLRARGRSSVHSQHTGRRERVAMHAEVLCAYYNGTQHQALHKSTTQACERHHCGPLTRARTKSDAWSHASTVAHARTASQQPHWARNALKGMMSGTMMASYTHTATHLHSRDTLRQHRDSIATRPCTRQRTQRPRPHREQQHATRVGITSSC
jgi:hypothetical protein